MHRETIDTPAGTIALETGRIARQAHGAVVLRHRDTVLLATAVAAEEPKPGQGFFPLTVEYRERLSAGRPDPRLLPAPRGADHRRRGPHLAPRRPQHPAAVPGRLPQRGPGPADRAVGRRGGRPGGLLDPRRGGGAAPVGRAVGRPPGRRADRARPRRVAPLPDAGGPGRRRPRPGRRVGAARHGDGRGRSRRGAGEAGARGALPRRRLVPRVLGRARPAARRGGEGKARLRAAGARRRDRAARRRGRRRRAWARRWRWAARRSGGRRWRRSARRSWPRWRRSSPGARKSCTRPGTSWSAGRCAAGSSTTACGSTAAARPRSARSAREAGWLPRPHGSAIFTRGETQALVTCTLGTSSDEQLVESLAGVAHERFLLHYNFPPYSVGEMRALRGPGRREIGHGNLAHRALAAVLPSAEEFPYTLRIVSDISESNGSSSMATVCGGSLALMDAGVPLRRAVAGIAMGMIGEHGKVVVLLGHPRRRGPPRRHGLQGGGDDARGSPRSSSTTSWARSRPRRWPRRSSRRGPGGCTSWARWTRRWPRRGRS